MSPGDAPPIVGVGYALLPYPSPWGSKKCHQGMYPPTVGGLDGEGFNLPPPCSPPLQVGKKYQHQGQCLASRLGQERGPQCPACPTAGPVWGKLHLGMYPPWTERKFLPVPGEGEKCPQGDVPVPPHWARARSGRARSPLCHPQWGKHTLHQFSPLLCPLGGTREE